ncbi:olfactory receptor 14C36-like [Apteryx mantelli]|uniref:Olfactory receptor 14C36-like n=1 Tax=Apteryx mantelli TaxID=2696672 RepID=A0ABM4F2A0_9AVES
MSNSSSLNEFFLLAFADTQELQLLHFSLFLGNYLAALLGNGLIITAVACDHHLHTPMYFFLLNLSLLDLGSISTTVPKSMANSLWDTRAISYSGCVVQLFFIVFFMSAEYSLLTVTAYDRFVAICKPLHYGTLMGSRACVKMAAAAWGSGFLYSVLHTGNTFSIPLCQGNTVDQFFCEIPQILKLSCSDSYLREAGLIVVTASLFFGCFVFIVLSYVEIFTAVLRILSEQGRNKAFSMCLPHLAVVSLFLSTAIYATLKPPTLSLPTVDLVVAVLYAVVPPAANPFIYSMRNKELKDALRKLVLWALSLSTPRELRGTESGSDEYRRAFGCFIFIVLSYVQIFTAVLRILSQQGRHKAFSMCLPHLAVVSLFVSTDVFAYLKPPSLSSPILDLVVAVLYLVVPPAMNPLIYSMRNKELKDALSTLVSRTFFSSGNIAIALHK